MISVSVALHAIVLLAQALHVRSDPFSARRALLLSQRADDPLLNCLQSKLSGVSVLETSGSPDFQADSTRHSILSAPTYRAVVKATSEHDIAASIQCAVHTNTSFLITSARHGYSTTLSSITNGLDIDITYLDQVQVNADSNEVIIGGGVPFQPVVDALYATGKEIPVGSCYCVGFNGAAMGGGVGRLSGAHGLILDSMLSVRMMLPNTTVVEASQTCHPDLFWGIRGSGFNYGVLLNATYRIYDQVPGGLHLNADFKFPLSQAKSYYEKLAEVAQKQPAPLSVITYYNFDPSVNQIVITANAVYAGSEGEGRQAVQFLVDQNPFQQNISMVPWNQLDQASAFGATGAAICERGKRRTEWGVGVKQINPDTYATLASLFQQMQTQYPQTMRSAVDMSLLPTQGVLAVPDNATAYPWRDHIAIVSFTFEYTDTTTDDEVTGYPRRMRDLMVTTAGTDDLEIYVHYSHGDETFEQLYSARKLPRLAALKKSIDPNGLFSGYHPVPASYP